MRFIGRILLACTIALVRPACWHSCRKTELSTCRAAGFRPKEMFEMPSVKLIPGKRRAISRIASIVSMRVAAGLLLAGGDRERQAVDEDVLDPQAPVAR